MDALDELEQMHQEARQAFAKIAESDGSTRGGLWAKLESELKLHEQIEERFVYDPVTEQIGNTNPSLNQFHEQHEKEAAQANGVMDRLGSFNPADAGWLTDFQQLQSMMQRHMQEEETQFWPLIRETWGQDKLDDAGRAVAASKAAGKVVAGAAQVVGKTESVVKGD